tara:strand:+ start:592 stop:972 length:381 start_codon:yes stop_codon:yes gene_type:complete
MTLTLVDALRVLRPNDSFIVRGDIVYENIQLVDKNKTLPTKDELNSKLGELKKEEPMKLLREKRNKLIAETDWTQLKDIDLDIIRERNWKNYRQALRDLPSKSNPKLDSFGNLDMSSVVWPDKPSP